MRIVLALLFGLFTALNCFAAASSANILTLNTASTNVTTSAFVQLSSSSPIASSQIVIANATSSIIKVALGASGSEVALIAVGASSQVVYNIGHAIPSGTRFSLEAVDATASSGYISVSLLP